MRSSDKNLQTIEKGEKKRKNKKHSGGGGGDDVDEEIRGAADQRTSAFPEAALPCNLVVVVCQCACSVIAANFFPAVYEFVAQVPDYAQHSQAGNLTGTGTRPI